MNNRQAVCALKKDCLFLSGGNNSMTTFDVETKLWDTTTNEKREICNEYYPGFYPYTAIKKYKE